MKRERIENEERLKKHYEKEFKDMKLSLEEQLNKYMKCYEELKTKYENAQ